MFDSKKIEELLEKIETLEENKKSDDAMLKWYKQKNTDLTCRLFKVNLSLGKLEMENKNMKKEFAELTLDHQLLCEELGSVNHANKYSS